MKETDNPVVDMLILRRDLYLVMSLLLADKGVAKIPGVTVWTKAFHETEVRRLMLWVATAARSLLDLSERQDIQKQICGEYWADLRDIKNHEKLTFRKACNFVIHAKEILPYKLPQQESKKVVNRVYSDRITVRGEGYRKKPTRAQIDIIKFVEISNTLINCFEEKDHADR